MAGYDLDYNCIDEIGEELIGMQKYMQEMIKPVAQEIGTELKNNVSGFLSIHDEATPKHGVHMSDDVKLTVSVNDKRALVTVKGGKQTGNLWWNVDNGHLARDGSTWVAGIGFTDDAYNSVNPNNAIDKMIKDVINE